MTDRLEKYISLIKEIEEKKKNLANLIAKEKPIKEIDAEFILLLIKEFPNSSIREIERIANMLIKPKYKNPNGVEEKIWSMIDMGILALDHNLKPFCIER